MAARSVIDIDLNDEKFKAFVDFYKNYEAAVAKQPALWQAISKQMDQARKAMNDEADAADNLDDAIGSAAKSQSKLRNEVSKTGREFKSIAKSTKSIAGNVKDATVWLLKWSAVTSTVSGLLGAGGLFGIDRLAANISTGRSQSKELGISQGEQNALEVNYGKRGIDVAGYLSKINEYRNDRAKQWMFGANGVSNWEHMSNAQIFEALLPNLKERFHNSNGNAANIPGLTAFGGIDQLNLLDRTSSDELAGMHRGYDRDRLRLEPGDDISKSWQDFSAQLARAGDQIENVFVKGLSPLTGPLSELSNSFAGALGDIMKNPNTKNWIHDLSEGVTDFSKYLQSNIFKQDVSDFINGVAKVATAMLNLAEIINNLFGPTKPQDVGDLKNQKNLPSPDVEAAYRSIELKKNIPLGTLSRLYSVETSFFHDPKKDINIAFDDATEISQLREKYHQDMRKVIAAHASGSQAVDESIQKYGADWLSHMSQPTQREVNAVVITVNNNTGGNAVINANQAARQY